MIAMAVIIALLGALLLLADRLAKHTRPIGAIGLKDAILIGLSQALAIFPGVSRSGSTITAGLALGLEREAAARFSFLLSAPIIAGAGAKSLYDLLRGHEAASGAVAAAASGVAASSFATGLPVVLVGFIVAALSGFLCIKVLLSFLQKHTTKAFVYYRWALAILVVAFALARG